MAEFHGVFPYLVSPVDSSGRVLQTTTVDQPASIRGRLMLDERETFLVLHCEDISSGDEVLKRLLLQRVLVHVSI